MDEIEKGFGEEYFAISENGKSDKPCMQGYKSVLNSKQIENNLTPPEIRSKIQEPCMTMSTETGKALKELAMSIQRMTSPMVDSPYIAKSKIAASNLKSMIKTKFREDTNLFEVVLVVTVASLLLDVVSSTERLGESIQELSNLAKFKNSGSKVAAEHPKIVPNQKEASQPC